MPWMPGWKRNQHPDEFAAVLFFAFAPLAIVGFFLAFLATLAYYPFGWAYLKLKSRAKQAPKESRS